MSDRGAVTALFRSVADDRRSEMVEAVGLAAKRTGDIVAVFAVLVLLMPILLVVCAALYLTSSRPLFYGHERIGRNGRRFHCLKFRTMYPDGAERLATLLASDQAVAAEWSRTRKLRNDPRVAPGGRFLRFTSLDELPQLINVIQGSMSLVGPRPITEEELSRYGTSRRDYLAVTPGITGLWQVSGRNNLTYRERVRLDARYAREWSLVGDFIILLRTPLVVFLGRGAR